jgi:hypothetical protein
LNSACFPSAFSDFPKLRWHHSPIINSQKKRPYVPASIFLPFPSNPSYALRRPFSSLFIEILFILLRDKLPRLCWDKLTHRLNAGGGKLCRGGVAGQIDLRFALQFSLAKAPGYSLTGFVCGGFIILT